MTLKTAVTLFGILLAGVFAALCLALVNTTELLDRQSQELVRAAESIRVAQSLRNRLLAHNRNTFLYQLGGDPSRFESIEAQRADIEALLREVDLYINTEEERRVAANVRSTMEAYLARREGLGEPAGALQEDYILASSEVDATMAVVEELTGVNRAQMEQLSSAIRARNREANIVAGILFVVGAVILGGVAVAVFRFIAWPLTRLARTISAYTESGMVMQVEPAGVDEIQELGTTFNSMTQRLDEKRKEQLRFIASIAHDLRNPLNSMSIATELLLRQQPSENTRMLEVVFRQVKVLERLVGDLLDTAHIESGHLELNVAPQDVGQVVRDAVELHHSASELHRFTLELDGDLECDCDGARLSQVVNNLLSNAIKYSPNGGVITVKARREADVIGISVADQGMGIDPKDVHNIFKPFHRTSATKGTIPGIGLGLSTSRRIVEAHGGAFSVSSEPGNGATFQVRVPCRPGRPESGRRTAAH